MLCSKKFESIHKNHAWDLVDLPIGKKPIGTKWICKVKMKPDGTIDRYKARLVAESFGQQKGTVAIAAHHGWKVHQLDIKIAFLNGDLEEELYVSQLSGFVVKG
ncbi:hypothetical protein L7F22_056285 [Adiantum nelumboides]|nr:hypothetical protein [Adiantum nelumboides]